MTDISMAGATDEPLVELAQAPPPPSTVVPFPAPPKPPASAPINEFDVVAAPQAMDGPINEFDIEGIKKQETGIRARASVISAQGSNPDAAAKALALSRKTGMPASAIEADPSRAQRRVALNEFDVAPEGVQQWVAQDPINARLANDDYESLGLLERGWNEIKRGFYGQREGVQALGATVAGQRMADLEAAEAKQARGDYLTPVEKSMLAQAPQARANAEAASGQSIGKLLENKRAAEAIPMRPALRELNDAKTWSDAWSALGKDPIGIIFDLTAGNLPQLLTSTAAAVVGGPVAGVAVMGGQSFAMEFVGGILDNMQELGIKTDDPEALRAAFANPELMATVYRKSTIKASVVGTLDAATMGIAGKTLVPAAVKGRLAREAINMPAQLAAQMAGGAGGEALGSIAAGNEVKPGAVLAEAVAELGSAPADVAAMRGFGKTKKPASPEQQQAEGQAAGLDKLVVDAQSTKLAGRSPEKLEEFLSTVTGPDQNVFIPAEAVQAYFQSQPIEDVKAMSDALGITDQLSEALARGGDIVIPLSKYVTESTRSDIHKVWREDVRMEADGFSIRQAQEDAKVRDARVKEAVANFEKQLEAGIAEVEAKTRVYEDFLTKLKSVGFTAQAAQQQAVLMSERAATRAARSPEAYTDAWDAYQKAGLGTGLDIRSKLSERVAAFPPDRLDVLLNSLKSGKVAPTSTDADANAQFAKDREELATELQKAKIDLKMSNAQIRAAIKAEVEKRAKGRTLEQPVYHGGPHIFDRFSLDKIGTGEGAQAFGWGLYFAGKKAVAQAYRRMLAKGQTKFFVDGNEVDGALSAQEAIRSALVVNARDSGAPVSFFTGVLTDFMVAAENGQDIDRAKYAKSDWSALANQIADEVETRVKVERPGRLYHVEIPDDGAYLNWDKPLSEQSPEVKAALKKMGVTAPAPPAPPRNPVLASILRRALKINEGDPRDIALVVNNDAALYKLAQSEAGAKRLEQLDLSPGEWVEKQAKEYLDGLVAERAFTGEKIYKELSERLAKPPPDEMENPDGPRGWGMVVNTRDGKLADDKAASLALREAGIPGIQYLDGSSRSDGEGSHNYVLFDDSLAEIKSYEQSARPTDTPAFKKWFGDSKVVDENGEPLVVFHGSTADVAAFNGEKRSAKTGNPNAQLGYFFSDNPAEASRYAKDWGTAGGNVMPVYLSIQNPYRMSYREFDSIAMEAWRGMLADPTYDPDKTIKFGDVEGQRAAADMQAKHDAIARQKALARRDELIAEGYDGVIVKLGGNTEFIAFEPGQIKSVHNSGAFDPNDPRILNQEARGQITFANNLSTITLFQGRDLSTLLHEVGHLWLEELGFDAKAQAASEQIKADYKTVLDWLGSKDGYITTEMHEQFARGFETYLMEGKAPSTELRSAFQSFKRWLIQIYKRLTALNSPITPEIRAVFDRLIATDEQIAAAQNKQGLNPVLKDAESLGMTKAVFNAYTKQANAVVEEAEQKLLQVKMAEIEKQQKAEWKSNERLVREDVTNEVMSESGMQALELLTKGEFPVGTTPEVLKGIKLTKEDIVDLYGDESVLTLLPSGIYRDRSAGPGAMSPDELAPLLGLDSGTDLIERLMQLEAQHKAMAARGDKRSVARARIDEGTAERMTERYGDPLDAAAIEQEAMAAVHSDKQAALMSFELGVLARKAGHTGTISWQDIQTWAATAIGEKTVREGTQSQQYLRAERTAGRKVEQALVKGDFVAAFKAKQDQLVNLALYRESTKAAEEADSARKLMDRYASAATIKNMDQDYLDQIHQLLEDYEFKNRSATLIAERKSFEAFQAEQKAMGVEVETPPRLAKGLGQTNYQDMTVDELRGLVDTIKQIAHLGRLKKTLYLDGKKRELDATLTKMEETAAGGVQRGASISVRGKSEVEISVGQARHWLRVANAELMKIERLLEFADGDKTGQGIFTRMIFKPIADAQDKTNDRRVELGKQQKEIYEKVPWAQRKMWTKRIALPELGYGVKLDKEGIIAIALNMGNEQNLEKMLEGEKWPEDGVRAVVNKHLTREEWRFVQDMWTLIDSQWPEFAAMARDTQGIAPPKVEAVPLETPYGTLAGGYYPIAYDRRENLKAAKVGEAQDSALLVGMSATPKYGRPTTRAGSSHARTGFSAPLDLSLSVIGKHLDEVTHDIFHRRAVMDIYKIISNDRFREALRSRLGLEYEAQFLPWLERVSTEARRNNTNLVGWDRAMKALRVNVTQMAMGLRVSTMVQQVSGYAVSMQRLGSKYMLAGVAEFARHPIDATAKAREASGALRHRANNLERDIKANVDKYIGKSTWKANLARFAFRGIALADMAVSVPTWIGAYHKGMAEGMAEADAIYYADKMVRDTQGEGAAKDMAAFQDGTETWKIMSMFYSFLNVFYNAQQGIIEDARNPGKSFSEWADLFWQASLLMVVSPLMAAMLAGQGPGDEEDPLWWALRKVGFGAFSGIPVVRDVANTLERNMGGQPSGGYKMSPVQGPIEGSLRLVNDLAKAASGEDVGDNFIKNTFNVIGAFTGLPTGQPGVTAEFLFDALIGGSENPENILEWMRGLTYGPKK